MIPQESQRRPRTLPRTLAALTTLFEDDGRGGERAKVPTTTSCPSCGQALVPVGMAEHTRQHAPWLCTEERLQFSHVELHPAAVRSYRSERRDWGPTAEWLRLAVARERGQ